MTAVRASAVAVAVLSTTLLAHQAGAGAASGSPVSGPVANKNVQDIRLRDDCDPVTFNATLGAGACKVNGGTTIDEFNAELAQRHSVNAWKYNPDHTNVKPGESFVVVNQGGETHTFTRVAHFGGGFVAGLNQASNNPVPANECATTNADGTLSPKPQGPNNMFVASGTQVPVPAIGDSTVLFQCCIHPWMRITITLHN